MRVINITVTDKIAVNTDNVAYVCGNSDYTILFDFDQEWEEFESKTARFVTGSTHQDVVFTGNECSVPVISNVGVFEVGVFAGNLHTTTPAYVPAKKSILCAGGVPADPMPDVYNQIMELLNKEAVPPAMIEQAIAQYLAEHPVEVEETDPTVPAWAKQPDKPTYTAEEVGAQPKGDYALKSEIPEIPQVPVQSVNGKTGDVKLSASDVGALPADTVIPAAYTLPTATADTLGGVKVGEGLQMDGDVLGVVPEGAYELIETITLAEDATLERTAEPDGTPYNFIAVFVELNSTLESFNGINFYYEFENGKSFPMWVDKYSSNTALNKKAAYMEVAKQYGLYHARYRPHTTNSYITNLQETVRGDCKGVINAIKTAGALPAGMIVNIWGVRANA